MTLPTDARPAAATLYYLPVTTRVPLKFGPETVTGVVCARVRLTVTGRDGHSADGWGETPLSVTWAWPSTLSYQYRLDAMQAFCGRLAKEWANFAVQGHPVEVGDDFQRQVLPGLLRDFNRQLSEPLPHLAA